MKKKTSVFILVFFLLFTAVLGYTAIAGWGKTKTGAMSNIKTGLDLRGGVSITYEATEAAPSSEDMNDTIWKMQQRVQTYSNEAQVYQQGLNRICIEIPGVSDANTILTELGKPGSLSFMDENGEIVLEGTDIADAQGVSQKNPTTGVIEHVVELSMTAEGREKFADATTANVGKIIYIIYDGAAISAPRVNTAITDGNAQITGMSSLEEAENLASFIRIGTLSLELEEIYSNVVGASLGQDALSTSLIAGIIGIAIVMLIMIFIYRISGFVAAWALLIFTFMDLIALNAFDITLTLPGIAGVILTIGMAVDANVIIYARSREELAAGRSLYGSLQTGFKKAASAIIDGNVTTLIAAAVLYFLGTGSIRGFAETLAMGIILSMISALFISRLLSYAMYGVGVRSEKAYGKLKERKPINFIGKKAICFTIAIVLIAMAPIGLAINKANTGKAMNYSLDFIGGTATTVEFNEKMSLNDLDTVVQPVVSEITGDANIQFQTVTGSNQVVIKTRELSLEERESLDQALIEKFDVETDRITAENISGTISGEMRANAFRAVIIAVIFMLIYIAIRFRDLRFATSSVLALIHDILIVLTFYVWFKYSVGSTFIAVMLTILGYSINSTIVIFDRIRENMRAMKGSSLKEIANVSITQTLTRSIYSSLTTFVTIFVLYIMGVPSIKEFAFPIIIGIIAGAYSSVCLSGAMWYLMKTKIGKNKIVETVKVEAAAEAAPAVETAKAAAVQGYNGTKKAKVDKTQYSSTKRKKSKR